LIFKQTTCQEVAALQHEEPVRLLNFGDENILVSASSKSIYIWDIVLKVQLRKIDAPQQCMAIKLSDHDQLLLGAMKDHRLKIWNWNKADLMEDVDWTRGLEEMTTRLYRRPITAAFSMDTELLAIIYKGQDILLWDLESDSLYDIYNRESGAAGNSGRPYGSSGVRCLVFGNAVNANLLATAFTDGELVVFDTSTGEVKNRLVVFAHILACSPDGFTLATADPSGTIQLFKFETMQLLYRINSVEPGIQGLAFSGDGLRLLDIRGSRCRVWGPAVLVGHTTEEESRDAATIATSPQEISLEPSENIALITSVVCHDSGEVFFCGKEDGSVNLYDIESGLLSQKLFSHAHGVAIGSLHFEEESQTLSSIDSSSRIMIHKLTHQPRSMVADEVLFDYRADMAVGQLVCETGLHRVLVCSTKSDMLWSISQDRNILLATISYQDREPYRWANHPSNPGHLILITRNKAHIYEWRTLQRLTGPTGILLEGDILPYLSIRSITPCFNGTLLATMFSESHRPHSKSKFVIWNTSEFTPESEVAVPVPAYRALTDKVEVFIGITGTGLEQTERLVFLHGSNWVCATDSQAAKATRFDRHFFFPTDWLSTNLELVIEVTKKGDIILVKRDEVAVVSKGLITSEYVEEGSGTP
jgi:WD40 repeat protein